MIHQPGLCFRVMSIAACLAIASHLDAETVFLIENKAEAPWNLMMYSNKKSRIKVNDGDSTLQPQEIKAPGESEYFSYKIDKKHTYVVSVVSKYKYASEKVRPMFEYGIFWIGDSNSNARKFRIYGGIPGLKEDGYDINGDLPMAECKSSGDNKDDGVTEFNIVDSRPVLLIKAPAYPLAKPGVP